MTTKVFRFPQQLFHLNRLRMDLGKVIHYRAMVIHYPAMVIHYPAMVIRFQVKVSAKYQASVMDLCLARVSAWVWDPDPGSGQAHFLPLKLPAHLLHSRFDCLGID